MKTVVFFVICATLSIAAAHEVPETNASSPTTPEQKEAQRQKYIERRRAANQITRTYENMFFKLAPKVYDQMMTAVLACNKQMGMDTETLKKCTSRRMSRHPDKKKAKPRSRRQVAESTTTVSPTGTPIVTDDVTPDTSSTNDRGTEVTNSWREVIKYEGTLVRCFVDDMRKTEFKDLTRKEWRDARDQKVTEKMKQKAECMKKQLFS